MPSTPCRKNACLIRSPFQHGLCIAAIITTTSALANENAAVHYQRALLFLGAVDPELRAPLEQPIWETVSAIREEEGRARANRLLFAARHAIRSALVGAGKEEADFGLDPETFAQSPLLPHCAPMGDLANLVTLYGLQLQSEEKWKDAADAYLAVIRMGRHMTHQSTLAESVVGMRMFESAFYGLCLWSAQCPDASLAAQVLTEFDALAHDLIDVSAVMGSDLKLRVAKQEHLLSQYPDGPWDEMLLDLLGVEPAGGDPARVRETAVAAATERGVPRELFNDRAALASYIQKLQALYAEYTEDAVACMKLASTPQRIARGAEIHRRFAPRFAELGNPGEIHPGQLVAFFASHAAERTLTRVVLAIATGRTDDRFPAKLDDVAGALGGSVPVSPYDGSPLVYAPSDDRSRYDLTIREATVGEITLPEIEFKSTGEFVE